MTLFSLGKDKNIPAIQGELKRAMRRKHEDFKTFITRESLEEIWTDERLQGLRKRYKAFQLDDIPRIRKDFLQTISILAYINWDGWSKFQDIFLKHNEHQNRTDKDIPENDVKTLESDSFLGPDWATNFSQARYLFCPIDIEEGVDRVLGEGWRLPFIKGEEIGQGAYGSVTKQYVAARHLRRDGSEPIQEDGVIACKNFKSHNDFRKEKENLERLREQLSKEDQNSRVMPFFTTITIGNEFNLFFECADTDLEHFLRSPSQGIAPRELIKESRGLAGALRFLHEDMDPQLFFCHMDLKPANILVSFKNAGSSRVGKWIISDFGISIITAAEEARPLNAPRGTFRYPFLTLNGAGTYQAPEITTGGYFGRKSDVWSLGCILVRVLAFGLDGMSGLRELDERRAKGVNEETKWYKNDFFHRGDPPVLNPHIEAWLNDLPDRVDLRLPQDALAHFRNLLFGALQIDTNNRLTAGQVKEGLHHILSLPTIDNANLADDPEVVDPNPNPDPTPPTTPERKISVVITTVLSMITERDPRQLAYFLASEVDIEQVVEAPNGRTDRLLIHAIRYRNYEIVDGLLFHRPNLDKEGLSSDGNTPLICAIKVADMDIVTLLLKSGASANAPSNGGFTPLMQATTDGHLDMVKLLLHYGAQCLARSKLGYTCLHLVARAPKHGVELIEEFKNRMPIDIYCSGSNETPLSTLIKEYPRKDYTEWWKKFNAFLSANADVNHADENGMTPLYHALRLQLIPVCKRLLEEEARLGSKSPRDEGSWQPNSETKRLLKSITNQPPPPPLSRLWSLSSTTGSSNSRLS
ncbi:hypothetical protein BDV06DRAFT_161573 [Aspergillus oleicola]